MSFLPNFRSRIRWRMRWLVTATVACFTLASPAALAARAHGGVLGPHVASLAAHHPTRKSTYIAQFRVGVSETQARVLMGTHGAKVTGSLPIIHSLVVRMSALAAKRLKGNYALRALTLNTRVHGQGSIDTSQLQSFGDLTTNALQAWNQGLTGKGVGVAVIDSGIAGDVPDFATSPTDPTSRVIATAVTNPYATDAGDPYGHGTHVAGIIAGNGWNRPVGDPLRGQYVGVAPDANLISIKAGDDQGNATVLDVINGLQFAIDHKDDYNIRVVNLSLESDTAESYKDDPLDAAAEAAWFHGIVVVTAAGNMGTAPGAVDYAPANDPYVITVGSMTDAKTADRYRQALHALDRQKEQDLHRSNQQAEQAQRQSDQQAEQAKQQADQQAEQAQQQTDQQNEQAQQQADQQAEAALTDPQAAAALHQTDQQNEQAQQQSDQQAEQAQQQTDQQNEQAQQQSDHQAEQAQQQTDQQAEQAQQQADQQAEQAQQQTDQQAEQAQQQTDQQAEQAVQSGGTAISAFTSRGVTQDGYAKPDVYAPGAHVLSVLAPGSAFAQMCPACTVGGAYIRASGTSMAAPVVSGAVADLLQGNPGLTPDQVKAALMTGSKKLPGGGSVIQIDHSESTVRAPANQGLTPSNLIDPATGDVSLERSSWRRSSWSQAPGNLTAGWARSSWSCNCSEDASGNVDATRSSWRRSSWSSRLVSD
jgi:subtilisin family serine protease